MGVIDIHVHHRWNVPDDRPEYSLRRLKSLAQANGIDRVLLLTLAHRLPPLSVRERNDLTLKLVREDPDFYIGACWLNPLHDPVFVREEVARCVVEGMRAIKLHMSLNARDHRHDTIMETAAEHDLPVVFHAWYKSVQKYDQEADGADIAYLARRHPRTKIVMAHLTGVGRRGVCDVEDLENVWIDTSGGFADSGLVEYAVRHMGAERVVYGSDYVGRDFATQLGRVYGADITDDERELILWKNASGLLKL